VQASQQPAENPPSNPAPSASGGNASPGAQNANQNPTPNAAPKETDIAPGAVPPTGAPQNTTPNNPPAADSQSSPPQTTGKAEKSSPEAAPDSSKTAKNEPSADTPETASNTNTESAEDADTPEAPATKPKAVRKPKPSPVPATDPDQALVSNAEKYLYGQGVPQNCDRALVSLRAAADRQSARARSLLGTMYATGHCVPKDLPNAYRWFALASRQQTDNMWIQRNLEMIWREMTPQERQLAMQTNR
jgi:TPR repeat protein